MQEARKFGGLVFVKHDRIGTRSEGPEYYLQTKDSEFHLIYNRELLFRPDYYLEFFCRKMVEVTGTLDENDIQVENISEVCEQLIPDNKEESANDLKKSCIVSVAKGIEIEIKRVEGWIAHNTDHEKLKALNERLAFLKEELIRYQSMNSSCFELPPSKELVGWTEGPCDIDQILRTDGMTKSGPWFHIAGIKGNDFKAIQPKIKYLMKIYLVYPRDYFGMQSWYIYIEEFKSQE